MHAIKPHVFLLGDRLKMGWINAQCIATVMMENKTIGDDAYF